MESANLMLMATAAVVGGILVSWVLGRISKKSSKPTESEEVSKTHPESIKESQSSKKLSKWWEALQRSRETFIKLGSSKETETLREALEEACLVSDLGVTNTQEALKSLDWKSLSQLSADQRLFEAKNHLASVIRPWIQPALNGASSASSGTPVDPLYWLLKHKTQNSAEPVVVWFVGVNGVGKTTSIAKLTQELKTRGFSVLLGAGDTFRAAAGEQLEVWAQRLGVDIVKGQAGADSSSVLFDSIKAGIARKVDFVLCDSAGRLHNQNQLMEALQKNRRVMQKALPLAPHETLLVLDAHTGQNMVSQADQFLAAVGITGLILTKLDGTARGGAVVAVARKTQLPIRRLGLGETAEDFVPFDAEEFSKALFGLES